MLARDIMVQAIKTHMKAGTCKKSGMMLQSPGGPPTHTCQQGQNGPTRAGARFNLNIISYKIYQNVDLDEFYVRVLLRAGWLFVNVPRAGLEWLFWPFSRFWTLFPGPRHINE